MVIGCSFSVVGGSCTFVYGKGVVWLFQRPKFNCEVFVYHSRAVHIMPFIWPNMNSPKYYPLCFTSCPLCFNVFNVCYNYCNINDNSIIVFKRA